MKKMKLNEMERRYVATLKSLKETFQDLRIELENNNYKSIKNQIKGALTEIEIELKDFDFNK